MKRNLLSATVIICASLLASPAFAQYVFTCVPPTEHNIGPKAPNVLTVLDVTGSMLDSSGEDVDGNGSNDSLLKVAKLAITDVANSTYTPGSCSGAGDPGCDAVRLGIGYFGSHQDLLSPYGIDARVAVACGEDTAPAIILSVNLQTAPGGTGTRPHDAMKLLDLTPTLDDNSRPNLAVVITDGEPSQTSYGQQAINNACAVRNRASNPVTTYMVGFGSASNQQINSALAAAGGTGECCNGGMTPPCAAANQVDVCALGGAAIIASTNSLTNGYKCTGSFEATGSNIKTALLSVLASATCVFELEVPPGYPSTGANADPDATEVEIYHALGGPIRIPPAGRGNDLPDDLMTNWGVSATTAAGYVDQGWEFTGVDRKYVRLTPALCADVQTGDITKVTTELACACTQTGQPCTLAVGAYTPSQLAVMRCSKGVYECINSVDICVASAGAMPEICNGLDDDCDGSVDNMTESWPNFSGAQYELPAASVGIDCNRLDTCICPNGATDVHSGTTPAEYYAAWSPVCQCGEGLVAAPNMSVAPESAAESEPSPDASGAACSSVGGGGPDLALLLLAAFGLVRRRR